VQPAVNAEREVGLWHATIFHTREPRSFSPQPGTPSSFARTRSRAARVPSPIRS
jgi:hypothetical protein